MELLVGCGSRLEKVIWPNEAKREWHELVTLDINPRHKPDIVHDLNHRPLPFVDSSVDEVHAYEVLEHLGKGIGDYKSWFQEWSEWWRILKPNGVICGTSPALSSRWLFGDPSHRRVVCAEMMVFLVQPEYTRQIGVTPMSDFRYIYKADFDVVLSLEKEGVYFFAMQAIKPSRIT